MNEPEKGVISAVIEAIERERQIVRASYIRTWECMDALVGQRVEYVYRGRHRYGRVIGLCGFRGCSEPRFLILTDHSSIKVRVPPHQVLAVITSEAKLVAEAALKGGEG